MEQLLNDFSPGLFFIQSFILVVLIFLLRAFAWKPILEALESRETEIEEAIASAKQAKEEMAKLTSDNQKLLAEAKAEREKIIIEAQTAAKAIIAEAREKAQEEGKLQLERAQAAIASEKNAAVAELKSQAVSLSLEMAEKVLRKELSDRKAQEALISEYLKEANLTAN